MSLRLVAIGVLVTGVFLGGVPARSQIGSPDTRIEMFSRAGCPHCENARAFLDVLRRERPDLEIVIRDVGSDGDARDELAWQARRHGVAPVGVPAFLVGDIFLMGFRDAATTGQAIRDALDSGAMADPRVPVWVPGLGSLNADEIGLFTFTVVLGLLDGLNPCAMWVLLILLSVLVGIRDRRKLILVAGTFVAVSGVAYFIFMAAWLNVFLWIGWSRPLQVALGSVAVCIGALHLKDGVFPTWGPSFSIPEAAKPGLYRRIRSILRAPGLAAAGVGAFGLAVTANAVELLCTAGLPALYTQILTLNELSRWQYYGYLALYNVAYMADDLLMVTIAVATMNRLKLQERHGRWLKGLSGALMLGLGLVLWFRPDWLTA